MVEAVLTVVGVRKTSLPHNLMNTKIKMGTSLVMLFCLSSYFMNPSNLDFALSLKTPYKIIIIGFNFRRIQPFKRFVKSTELSII